jgi:hypothetical protein
MIRDAELYLVGFMVLKSGKIFLPQSTSLFSLLSTSSSIPIIVPLMIRIVEQWAVMFQVEATYCSQKFSVARSRKFGGQTLHGRRPAVDSFTMYGYSIRFIEVVLPYQ